jgi:hypothetical protein
VTFVTRDEKGGPSFTGETAGRQDNRALIAPTRSPFLSV